MENGAPSMLCFSAVSWMDIRALSAVVMTEEVENSWPGFEIQRQISFFLPCSGTQSCTPSQERVEFKINT